ncbi:hypothetical protein F3Y22_tig00110457pilonHSYRG00091 [Hibiscus syriacus]|uniref:Uncharacterized protein n=1 Tax=Hibiscus syriacus TaxID=106335 RepID=A0A6A3ALW0_HIBSY|nr:hypothetical protein F3Y22_tig00110457pilonHSYRG00091 [Hibiscus syriacus]
MSLVEQGMGRYGHNVGLARGVEPLSARGWCLDSKIKPGSFVGNCITGGEEVREVTSGGKHHNHENNPNAHRCHGNNITENLASQAFPAPSSFDTLTLLTP